MDEFFSELAEILDVEVSEIHLEYELEENRWDSLAILSVMAAVDMIFNKAVSGDALAGCKKVSDIMALTED